MSKHDVPGSVVPEKSIRKSNLEEILCTLLIFLKPDTFQGAVKAINERTLLVLDENGSGRLDLGMFLAILALICGGPLETRKRIAIDALLWRPMNEGGANLKKVDAIRYIKLLRTIYVLSHNYSELMELHSWDATTVHRRRPFCVS
ncbi:hypothetical protein P8452_07190 [Trifolium repens]|nr:hypothetical protein P8452_07190 [Trifolium repens]